MENIEQVISFVSQFNDISVSEAEEILEWLEGNNYLTAEGKEFRKKMWEMFVKKSG